MDLKHRLGLRRPANDEPADATGGEQPGSSDIAAATVDGEAGYIEPRSIDSVDKKQLDDLTKENPELAVYLKMHNRGSDFEFESGEALHCGLGAPSEGASASAG